ncbi:MAG TPA: hypothetical protein VFF05_09270 [Rudaea sp.]|nr:hypothetical protein [Rudaea sp.]
MELNGKPAALARIFCAAAMLSTLGGMLGCSGSNVGPEPPWNLSAQQAPTDGGPAKQHENH